MATEAERRQLLLSAINEELLAPLRKRYESEEEGKCRVCGADLAIGAADAQGIEWYCSSKEADWLRSGGSIEHWRQSKVHTKTSDSQVLALVDLAAKMAEILTTEQLELLAGEKG